MADTPYPVVEAPLPADLSLYEEIFVSSTSMHVMPVSRIDGQPIGSGRAGPITKLAMARFESHYRAVMAY
jgi:branched-subunit amino acid aminotransferase/4-amino-4-deoxychorismate lyase